MTKIEITDEMATRLQAKLRANHWIYTTSECVALLDAALNTEPEPRIVVTEAMIAAGAEYLDASFNVEYAPRAAGCYRIMERERLKALRT